MQTCVVHSTELHTGSGLPGTQGKKDDSGSYINDIIRRQREVDWDGAPAAVRRSIEFQKTLSGSGGLHPEVLKDAVSNILTADTVSCPIYKDMTLPSEGRVSQSLPLRLGSLQESQPCFSDSSSCRQLPSTHCVLGTVLGSGGHSGAQRINRQTYK